MSANNFYLFSDISVVNTKAIVDVLSLQQLQ